MSARSRLSALVVAVLLMPMTAAAQQAVIHMSPNGRDEGRGETPQAPIATLSHAHDIIANYARKALFTSAVVRIAPGTYNGQTVVWRWALPEGIVITGPDGADRPVFDGGGMNSSFLRVDPPRNGGPARITIRNLEIRDYFTAINMSGDRDNLDQRVSDVILDGNIFRRIGGMDPGDDPATGVVRLVNADRVTVRGNLFHTMINRRSCELLHALYIAHDSDDNVIEGNEFVNSCGDPIRTRDMSDNNLITRNKFENIGDKAIFSDWYCREEIRDCPKRLPECPSVNNQFVDNWVSFGDASADRLVFLHGPDDHPQCANRGDRFRSRGNDVMDR